MLSFPLTSSVPLNLAGTRLHAESEGDGSTLDGVAYTTYDVVRVNGKRRQRIANVTVYASGTVLINYGPEGGSTVADYTARDRLREHLETHYSISPVSIYFG